MSHYHHLTLRDRVFISALTISGKSLSEIACAIGKNVSTISRELKRNKAASAQDGASAVYDPCAAQARYQRQRKHCGKRNILKSDSLVTAIVPNLLVKEFWSPEQIQYRLRKELANLRISATTITEESILAYWIALWMAERCLGTCDTTLKRVTVKA